MLNQKSHACHNLIRCIVPLTFALVLLLPEISNALAADSSGAYFVQGAGLTSCGKYLKESEHEQTDEETWMTGYISGYNYWNTEGVQNALSKTDFDGAVGWVKIYCKSNPTDSLAVATRALIEFLRKK